MQKVFISCPARWCMMYTSLVAYSDYSSCCLGHNVIPIPYYLPKHFHTFTIKVNRCWLVISLWIYSWSLPDNLETTTVPYSGSTTEKSRACPMQVYVYCSSISGHSPTTWIRISSNSTRAIDIWSFPFKTTIFKGIIEQRWPTDNYFVLPSYWYRDFCWLLGCPSSTVLLQGK